MCSADEEIKRSRFRDEIFYILYAVRETARHTDDAEELEVLIEFVDAVRTVLRDGEPALKQAIVAYSRVALFGLGRRPLETSQFRTRAAMAIDYRFALFAAAIRQRGRRYPPGAWPDRE